MPVEAIHPGEHVSEEIDAMGTSAEVFATQLGVTLERLTGLLDGQTILDAEMALRLSHFFGTSPQFWLNLQNLYDLRKAEERSGESIRLLPTIKELQAA